MVGGGGCVVETSVETSSGEGVDSRKNADADAESGGRGPGAGGKVGLQLRVMGLYCCVTAVTRGAFASSCKLVFPFLSFLIVFLSTRTTTLLFLSLPSPSSPGEAHPLSAFPLLSSFAAFLPSASCLASSRRIHEESRLYQPGATFL